MIPAGLLLVDTSAIARAGRVPAIARILSDWGREGLLATCATVDLEVLYSARNPGEFRQIAGLRKIGFLDLPLSEGAGVRAREVQTMLARSGKHRAVGVVDLLTAAVAELHRAVVVHYDHDFDRVHHVTGQATRWVVPRGSVD